jgi:hypothetical protein
MMDGLIDGGIYRSMDGLKDKSPWIEGGLMDGLKTIV